jgi:hypothetical protein
VTTAIVGEKQARTLEPLLATPLTTAELLVAKTGTAFVLALTLLATGLVLLIAGTALAAAPGVAATLVTGRVIALVGGVAPAASLVALTLGAIVSSRAKDARAAQQAGRGRAAAGRRLRRAAEQPDGVLHGRSAARDRRAGGRGRGGSAGWPCVFDRERILTEWT